MFIDSYIGVSTLFRPLYVRLTIRGQFDGLSAWSRTSRAEVQNSKQKEFFPGEPCTKRRLQNGYNVQYNIFTARKSGFSHSSVAPGEHSSASALHIDTHGLHEATAVTLFSRQNTFAARI